MKLIKLNYSQYAGEPQEWRVIDCTFDDVNLIVGKNATGKTMTLNVIRALADLLSGISELKWSEGNFEVDFEYDEKIISYDSTERTKNLPQRTPRNSRSSLILCANQLIQMNIFTLLLKNLCALGVLAVKMTFFQRSHKCNCPTQPAILNLMESRL